MQSSYRLGLGSLSLRRTPLPMVLAIVAALIGSLRPAYAQAAELLSPIDSGQRVFSAGHSFHMFVPALLREMSQAAGIRDHTQVGAQSLGGSRVIQHWDLADEKNKAKQALLAGSVDVLTLSPIYLPDDGIEHFVKLALDHNPKIRITLQEFWLPFDVYDVNYQRKRPEPVDRNSRTVEQLRAMHVEYFQSIENHVRNLNQQYGKQVLFVVPVAQAVIALREKIIAQEAPGLNAQTDLFTDAIGHPTPPLQALVGYCHFAVVYRRTPVGLPLPDGLAKAKNSILSPELNLLLQQLAWDAAIQHPLSGLRTSAASSPDPK